MFNNFYTFKARNSSWIDCVIANPFTGVVKVMTNDGRVYSYVNVSRRAIMNLIIQDNMSLGFWVNDNCIQSMRALCQTMTFAWLSMGSFYELTNDDYN